ncbi:MAG: hypothetical protein KAT46_07560, partial [Deltaproteobacteria bacterium]|nr:hypothetical protein [Deltaproteobacteria bacterium]
PFAEGDCSACHEKGTKKIKSTKSDLCLKCHESTMESFNKRFSHLLPGSDSNFCLNCHSPHASASEALLKDRPDVVCYKCHEASKTFSEASRFRHPKVLDCTICHSAHGSNSRDFMKKGDGTCAVAECHESQVAFSHPVGDDVIDKRLNEPVNCVTCHNPMGAPFEKNLKGDKNTDLCNQCHQI